MADSKVPEPEKPSAAAEAKPNVAAAAKKPLKPPNPMWKYMGFGENFRPRIPSRNWLIFLSITGSFTAAVVYDKRETRRAQRKWCKMVEHISKEPLDPRAMARRLTVVLEGPPGDGLRVAQDHFKEYVKPVLVASGLDWEFVQGRTEGDVRAEIADRIRNGRLPVAEQMEENDPILSTRRKQGVKEFEGPRGDIVVGRHAWKEYVRGVHEGWLGPLTEPAKPEEPSSELEAETQQPEQAQEPEAPVGTTIHSSTSSEDDASPAAPPPPPAEEKPKEQTKSLRPPPFISTLDYASASLASSLPPTFSPSAPIAFPHILGFFNTHIRLYRFLTRRRLADQIGRDVASVVLAHSRPYSSASTDLSSDSPSDEETEIQKALEKEEGEWHKSVRVRKEGDGERTWLDGVVLDERIAGRMRRAELSPEDEERVKGIKVREEEVEGWIKGGIRQGWRWGVDYLGFGGKDKKNVNYEDE